MPENLREFVDDVAVQDQDILYRAFDPRWVDDWLRFSGETAIIESRVWQDYRDEDAAKWGLRPCVSVAVAKLLEENARDIDYWLKNIFCSSYGVIETTAGEVRNALSLNGEPVPQGVMLHPTLDQPWHAVVWSKRGAAKRSKSEMRGLVLGSRWTRLPAPP